MLRSTRTNIVYKDHVKPCARLNDLKVPFMSYSKYPTTINIIDPRRNYNPIDSYVPNVGSRKREECLSRHPSLVLFTPYSHQSRHSPIVGNDMVSRKSTEKNTIAILFPTNVGNPQNVTLLRSTRIINPIYNTKPPLLLLSLATLR